MPDDTVMLWLVRLTTPVLECFVTKRRNKAAAKKFLIKAMRKYGSPRIITLILFYLQKAINCEKQLNREL